MPASLTDQLASALDARHDLLEQLQLERTTAYRLFHGSVEGQPGLTVDRYGDVLLVHSALSSIGDWLPCGSTDTGLPSVMTLRTHSGA